MRYQECLKRGFDKEEEFAKLLVSTCGGVIQKANPKEDIHDHIDLWWIINGKTVGLDIKALKKQSRNDKVYSNSIHWIELKNVNGKPGWLFGKSDYIVFEGVNMWIVVKRKILLTFLKQNVNFNTIHESLTNLNTYELYRRSGRSDLILKIPVEDLLKLNSKIIIKNEAT